MPVVSTPDTAHGENTIARAIARPTKVSLTISASARPSTSCSDTSTTTHRAVNPRLCQKSGSSVSMRRKLSSPAKPSSHGLPRL
jgi:hypothetical protein